MYCRADVPNESKCCVEGVIVSVGEGGRERNRNSNRERRRKEERKIGKGIGMERVREIE